MAFDYVQLARELAASLRGSRSQVQWSRRLGYKSNVAYSWESGRRWPTGAEFLRACGRNHVDVPEAITRFYGRRPAWMDGVDPATPAGVAALLEDLRGSTSVADLARRTGVGRFAVSRWLAGQTQPRLPDFLHMVDASSVRLVDFLAELVDPGTIETIREAWTRLEARRRGAHLVPWAQAVLCALDLAAYGAAPHQEGWIAERLGVPQEVERASLEFLARTGQIVFRGGRWVAQDSVAVDTRRYPEVGRALKVHWTEAARDRIAADASGMFSYNVFVVSHEDLAKLRALHREYFAAFRGIVAASQAAEVVAVANVQLFALTDEASATGRAS
jgi:hypothetical protein